MKETMFSSIVYFLLSIVCKLKFHAVFKFLRRRNSLKVFNLLAIILLFLSSSVNNKHLFLLIICLDGNYYKQQIDISINGKL